MKRLDFIPQSALSSYSTAVNQAAKEFSLDPGVIWTVMAIESNFDPGARSAAGALGLMQVMPSTAADLGVDIGTPEGNIRAGAMYLRRMLTRYSGNLAHALAAYNMGPTALGLPPRKPGTWCKETQLYLVRFAEKYFRSQGGA